MADVRGLSCRRLPAPVRVHLMHWVVESRWRSARTRSKYCQGPRAFAVSGTGTVPSHQPKSLPDLTAGAHPEP